MLGRQAWIGGSLAAINQASSSVPAFGIVALRDTDGDGRGRRWWVIEGASLDTLNG